MKNYLELTICIILGGRERSFSLNWMAAKNKIDALKVLEIKEKEPKHLRKKIVGVYIKLHLKMYLFPELIH